MSKSSDFFRALRDKTSVSADRAFDSAFWKRHHAEFGTATAPTRRSHDWTRRALLWLVPSAVALLLAVVAVQTLRLPQAGTDFFSEPRAGTDFFSEPRAISDIMTYQPVLEDLDLLSGAASDRSVDFTELSDAEWKVLLEGKDG